jgi:hypothetical protein
MIQPILNKWQFEFTLQNSWVMKYGFEFQFGLFKITKFPNEGEMLSKKDYKGFLITKNIYLRKNININKILW